jgi:hypothetical protein
MSDFEREQIMQNRDLQILAKNLAIVHYQEFLLENLPNNAIKENNNE